MSSPGAALQPRKRKLSDALDSDTADATLPPKTRRRSEPPVTELRLPAEGPPSRAPEFQRPLQLISFSYTPDRALVFDDSAMRYFAHPTNGVNLGHRYEYWTNRTEERPRLDGLLEACLRNEVAEERRRAHFVTWRGVMTKILVAPYEDRVDWELNVMSLCGTIYVEEHMTDAKLQEKDDLPQRRRIQMYHGYAFESFCTTDKPPDKWTLAERAARQTNMGWGGDVNTNVQWCSVIKGKIANKRLILGGEVDCVRDTYTGQPNTFVELKTSMTIRGPPDEVRFERKLLKFYMQSFLLGVPEIVVGFRTPAGVLSTVQTFKTLELQRLVRDKEHGWDANRCLSWGSQVLEFIEDKVGRLGNTENERVWRLSFKAGVGVTLRRLSAEEVEEVVNSEDRVGFLPRWYWDAVQA